MYSYDIYPLQFISAQLYVDHWMKPLYLLWYTVSKIAGQCVFVCGGGHIIKRDESFFQPRLCVLFFSLSGWRTIFLLYICIGLVSACNKEWNMLVVYVLLLFFLCDGKWFYTLKRVNLMCLVYDLGRWWWFFICGT